MSLSAHLLRQLLPGLKTDAGTHRGGADKRSGPRVGLRHPVRIVPVGAEAIGAWVRNVSADGIGLLARRPLAAGAEFVVPFDRPDAGPLRVLYRATHVARVGAGLYAVGGRVVCVVEPRSAGARAIGRAAS